MPPVIAIIEQIEEFLTGMQVKAVNPDTIGRFIQSLDPDKADKKAFKIEDDTLELSNRLQQKCIAEACARWIQDKVEIRSSKQSNLLHGKMYHTSHNEVDHAIIGSSNFTVRGLGLGSIGNNIEPNLEVDSNRDRLDLKAWFSEGIL